MTDWRLWVAASLLLPSVVSWADVAVLREKGPWSGSAFSNPGVLSGGDPSLKVTMVSADVKIHLRQGAGDQLSADCEAEFLLEDRSDSSARKREFLVAFPVTGLSSKIVTVSNFVVQVQGERPATVLRQAISISRRESTLKDTAIFGQLEERFQLGKNNGMWGITLADKSLYRDAYVWLQKSSPGVDTRIRVTYTASLRPQAIKYSKSYNDTSEDSEVIPFADLEVNDWNEKYYFFDYVLTSGSTWFGPIGHEKITLTISPELKLNKNAVVSGRRSPIGYRWHQDDRFTDGASLSEAVGTAGSLAWELKGKPREDWLIAIPLSGIGHSQAASKR